MNVVDRLRPRWCVQGQTHLRIGEEARVQRIGGVDLGVIDVWLLERMAATHGVCLIGVRKAF